MRRLIVHEAIRRTCSSGSSTRTARSGSATRADGTLIGPLIDADAVERDAGGARRRPATEGGRCLRRRAAARDRATTSSRRSSRCAAQTPIVREETFAPDPRTSAISRRSTRRSRCHNDVPQGLSSSHLHATTCARPEQFLSAAGSTAASPTSTSAPSRRRDRRRVRRREGDRRRPRVGLGRVEGLHAPADRDDQLLDGAAARAGREVRRRLTGPAGRIRGDPPWGLTPGTAKLGSDPKTQRATEATHIARCVTVRARSVTSARDASHDAAPREALSVPLSAAGRRSDPPPACRRSCRRGRCTSTS